MVGSVGLLLLLCSLLLAHASSPPEAPEKNIPVGQPAEIRFFLMMRRVNGAMCSCWPWPVTSSSWSFLIMSHPLVFATSEMQMLFQNEPFPPCFSESTPKLTRSFLAQTLPLLVSSLLIGSVPGFTQLLAATSLCALVMWAPLAMLLLPLPLSADSAKRGPEPLRGVGRGCAGDW